MRENPTSQSGICTPRVLVAIALCSVGFLLAMFSLAAAPPPEPVRVNTSGPPDPANFLRTSGTNANLPPGVPLPADSQFSPDGPLAAGAQGEWSIVSSPNQNPAGANILYGVTCVSASDCWAVGYYYNGSKDQTLIEHWDGTSWVIVSSPNASATQNNYLYGVTCASASECWAVGNYRDATSLIYQTLIERWDGTSWAIVNSANTSATQNNYLYDVTCASASDCWAVGYYYANGIGGEVYQSFIERWNGSGWVIVASPTLPSHYQLLFSVTCVSTSDCWAAGFYFTPVANAGPSQTLIEHWDGTSWSTVTSPNTSTAQSNYLYGVACASASDCWAVGHYFNGVVGVSGTTFQTLIERWNGTSWAIVSSPNTDSTLHNTLQRVTCVSASNCWAVGTHNNGRKEQTLTDHWDGSSWAVVSSPNTNTTQNEYVYGNYLHGLACASASDCWAVGNVYNSQTLVLRRYTPATPPAPLSAVSRKTHGSVGTFHVDLKAPAPGIECRAGGTSGDHQVVISFANSVTVGGVSVSSKDSMATATQSVSDKIVTVDLHNVTNVQTLTITLTNVSDQTNSGDLSISMGVLIGDTTADKFVNSADISQTKSQSGTAVTSSNFGEDLNADGSINSADIALAKSKSGTALP